MPKQMTLRRLEMAETRINYASHASGKDIQNRDSILGEILRAVTFLVFWPGGGRHSARSQNLAKYRILIFRYPFPTHVMRSWYEFQPFPTVGGSFVWAWPAHIVPMAATKLGFSLR